MAADSVHIGGEFRPSHSLPLPAWVDLPCLMPRPCPQKVLLWMHTRSCETLPYLGLDPGFPENLAEAEQTIVSIQAFDADERVLVVFAHDVSMFDILEFYPKSANGWKQKGWKEKGR